MNSALITGGSSGIGYGLSEKFASEGYRLLWVSKPKNELAKAKEEILVKYPNLEIHTIAKDLSVEQSCKEVLDWANTFGDVDVLVNNAGFGTYGYVNDIAIDREIAMINLNVKAVYEIQGRSLIYPQIALLRQFQDFSHIHQLRLL